MPEHLKVIMSLRLEDAFDFDEIALYIIKNKSGEYVINDEKIGTPELLEEKIEEIKDLIEPELLALKAKINKIIDLLNK